MRTRVAGYPGPVSRLNVTGYSAVKVLVLVVVLYLGACHWAHFFCLSELDRHFLNQPEPESRASPSQPPAGASDSALRPCTVAVLHAGCGTRETRNAGVQPGLSLRM
eukprot:1057958-Rhodomonas_salina.2